MPASSDVGEPASMALLDVSIVMPCLNEELPLPQCLRWAQDALETLRERHGLSGEVVVSDNGSSDRSIELARAGGAQVVHCPHKGYGNALKYGVKNSRGRYIVIGDADGSYDFREAVAMVEKLMAGFDLCMGSRFKGKILPGAMPWKNRYIGNPVLSGILNLLFRSGMSDAHSGLRAFTRSGFKRIAPTSSGMEFASEIVIKATLINLSRTEVPITLHKDLRQRPPHLRPWQDGWRHLRYLLMLSPVWLFLAPAGLLGAAAALLFTLLLSTPEGKVVHLGPIWFGDHWSMIASAAATTAHWLLLVGLVSTVLGVRERYRKLTPWLAWVLRICRLDNLLILGAFMLIAAVALLAYVVFVWQSKNFGPLAMTRPLAMATTLGVLGIQSLFGGFLISIAAGNDADGTLDIPARRPGTSNYPPPATD
jgi:hypothetical protein